MIRCQAPAKLNLSLKVSSAGADGYHPLDSVVQTIELCDLLTVEASDADELLVTDPSLDTPENLVWRAVEAIRSTTDTGGLRLRLKKNIPHGSGLGGGSSNAAAVFKAIAKYSNVELNSEILSKVGADVPLFMDGGTQRMTGIGDRLERLDPLAGFAIAVAVPGFGLSTAEVYSEWDRLGEPIGPLVPNSDLPDELRALGPIRNDLLPAAVAVDDRLSDFMHLLENEWGRSVSLTGSGSGCFGYFASVSEAEAAAEAVADRCRFSVGVRLRPHGVTALE